MPFQLYNVYITWSSLPSVTQFLCLLLPSLSIVLCPLSHVFVCTLSPILYVPCLKSLFFVSRPLSPVSRIKHTIRCPQSYVSVPCSPSSVPCLTALLLVCHPLCPVSRVLIPVSHPSFRVKKTTSVSACYSRI